VLTNEKEERVRGRHCSISKVWGNELSYEKAVPSVNIERARRKIAALDVRMVSTEESELSQ
jgi:DNA-binding response OmpR family regulator